MTAGQLTSGSSFTRDFFDIKEIGRGEHGTVYSCVRKMDLWPYAVKVVETRGGAADRERTLQEIYAMAAQGDNPGAIRYHSAWEEGGAIYIQTELCVETLLAAWAAGRGLGPPARAAGVAAPRVRRPAHSDGRAGGPRPFTAGELWRVAGEAAAALLYMHEHGMAHLDVKVRMRASLRGKAGEGRRRLKGMEWRGGREASREGVR
jgi:serine/threonine protein kinase